MLGRMSSRCLLLLLLAASTATGGDTVSKAVAATKGQGDVRRCGQDEFREEGAHQRDSPRNIN
jgi:hypothetical protein